MLRVPIPQARRNYDKHNGAKVEYTIPLEQAQKERMSEPGRFEHEWYALKDEG